MIRVVTLVLCAAALGAVQASAHHSVGGYMRKDGVFLIGTVKEFRWANPHVMLTLEVGEPGTAPQEWVLETVSVGQLVTANFRKSVVKAGDRVTVSYFPRRDGKAGGFFYALTAANGKSYALQRPQRVGSTSFAY